MKKNLFLCTVILTATLASKGLSQPSTSKDGPDDGSQFQQMWDRAAKSHKEEKYGDSERLYREVLVKYPKSQRAALRVAIAIEKQGRVEDALAAFDQANAVDPWGDWAAVTLYYKAKAAVRGNRKETALAACATLLEVHPESAYAAQAQKLKAELKGEPIAEAQAALDQELELGQQLDSILADTKVSDSDRVVQLSSLINSNHNSRAALRGLEARGHLLIRSKEYVDALSDFSDITTRLKGAGEKSRIYRVAQRRIAGIFHVLEKREEALDVFLAIRNDPGRTDKDRAEAQLQVTGLYFELLQRSKDRTTDEMDTLLELCSASRSHPGATLEVMARADLMRLEALYMYGRYELYLKDFEAFTREHGTTVNELRTEIATAHFGAALALRELGRIDESLSHWQAVIDLAGSDLELWPEMDHVSRSYAFRVYTLRELGRDDAQVMVALSALIERYPQSVYTEQARRDFSRLLENTALAEGK